MSLELEAVLWGFNTSSQSKSLASVEPGGQRRLTGGATAELTGGESEVTLRLQSTKPLEVEGTLKQTGFSKIFFKLDTLVEEGAADSGVLTGQQESSL